MEAVGVRMIRELKRYPMYYGGVKQTYPHINPGVSFFSKSVIVGNIVFLNSFDGRSLETCDVTSEKFEEQLVVCLDNIRLALEEAGSSMSNVVKSLVLLRDYKDSSRMWKTMLEYYQKYAPELVEEPPAITVTQVEALAKPECLVEIDALAVISRDEPGWEMKKHPMLCGDVKQVYPNVEPGMPFLSESVSVGNLIYLSGMSGENPDTGKIETNTFEEQWETALDKVNAALDRAGSSMSNLIKTLHFQCRLDSMLMPSKDMYRSHSPASDRLWKTELEYFDRHAPYLLDEFPASTFLKVSSLANPEALGQTEVIGVFDRFRHGWEVKKYPTYVGRRGFPRHVGDIKKYYSNMVKVGNLLYISGQTATDIYTARIESSAFGDQLLIALKNLRAALEEAGSSLDNLVKTYILLPKAETCSSMRKIELEFYQKYAPRLVEEPPASTVIHPYNLASPTMLIEIDAIGFIPDI
jgi:2-iminobutanoate/2-iminopropanoate deaminase